MSVAFVKEESAEAASETVIGERPISPYPNLVTEAGFRQLESNLQAALAACEAAEKIEDINERRRQSALPLRDARYFAARVRSARVVEAATSNEVVAFGTTVTFQRNDGQAHEGRAAIVGVHVLGLRILLIGHHETAAPSGKNTWPEDRGGGVKAPLTICGGPGFLSTCADVQFIL